ncbi:hypothetical protein PUN28_017950 [Cardiocondyla obscurior]|uniref:Uncharacterized protein n=1 Tax=Cardiocondyla obscurior TaxID=286306 RepID=A0AAW2EF93_9HYME
MEKVSDVCKLIADLQHDESLIRSNLLIANVFSSMKDTLPAISIDEFIFGENLEEDLKNVKSLQTTEKDWRKPSAKPAAQTKTQAKNVKPLPR